MGKLAIKIYKALYGLDIEAQNIELTRLRLENKRLSELLRSTSREYNSLNERFKRKKESIETEYESVADELRELRELRVKYETVIKEKENLEKTIPTANEKMSGEMDMPPKAIEEPEPEKEEENDFTTEETTTNEEITANIEDEETRKDNMQKEILSITQHFEYIRITTTIGNQYIYQSRHFGLRTGLFDWGIEGKEMITDETLYLDNSLVSKMEGLSTPFIGDELVCNPEDENSSSAIADALLMAICTYQPVQVNYRDKNGRITQKNLFHVTFKPFTNNFKLPYKNIFKDMLEERIDPEQLSALCPHNPEPRNFAVLQIQALRRFNAFFTTQEGIETLKEGIELAKEADQAELAEVLRSRLKN